MRDSRDPISLLAAVPADLAEAANRDRCEFGIRYLVLAQLAASL